MSREAFIDLVTADQPDAPPYFTYDAVLNSRERPTLDQALARELRPLTIEELLAEQARGAQVLDTRESAAFAAAHLAGSINIGLIGQYATWAGTVLSRDAPIVLVADPGTEMESALRLGRIGFDHVVGYLAGGLASAECGHGAHRDDGARRRGRRRVTPRVGGAAGAARRAHRRRSVRRSTSKEARTSRSITSPSDCRRFRRDARCCCTARAATARRLRASLLQREGFTDVSELAGGIAAWEAAGLPTEVRPKAGHYDCRRSATADSRCGSRAVGRSGVSAGSSAGPSARGSVMRNVLPSASRR